MSSTASPRLRYLRPLAGATTAVALMAGLVSPAFADMATTTATSTDTTSVGTTTTPTLPTFFPPISIHMQGHFLDWGGPLFSNLLPLLMQYQYSHSSQTTTDGSFAVPDYTSNPDVGTGADIGTLAPGTYYWHGRLIDSLNVPGPWSLCFSFTIDQNGTPSPLGSCDANTGGGTGTTTPGTGTTTPSTGTTTPGTGTTTPPVTGDGNGTSTTTIATSTSELIVVHPSDLDSATNTSMNHGSNTWFYFDPVSGMINNANGSFGTGPGTPPFGTGSAQLMGTASSSYELGTYRFGSVRLGAISNLSFSTYMPTFATGTTTGTSTATTTASTTPTQVGAVPFLTLAVQLGTGSTTNGTFTYNPGSAGAANTWQNWTATGAGAYWHVAGNSTAMTWNQLMTAYPNASLDTARPSIAFGVTLPASASSTASTTATGYIDGFSLTTLGTTTVSATTTASSTVTTTSAKTTFDFEPAATTTTSSGGGSGSGGGGGGSTGTSGGFSSGGGGGSGSSGGTGGSVLGNSTDVPSDTGSVLGATTPGTPNTGAGGYSFITLLVLMLAAIAAAGGITMFLSAREPHEVV